MPSSLALTAIIGAPLLGFFMTIVWSRAAAVVASLTSMVVLVAAVFLAMSVSAHGAVLTSLGGWDAPLGIELAADGLSVMFMVVSGAIVLVVGAYAQYEFVHPGTETRSGFAFWPLMLVLLAALNGIFVSRDFFNLYVCFELLTLSAVAMVILNGKAESITAALRYLLFALFGSILYLLGAVLLYAQFGSLDMGVIGQSVSSSGAEILAAGLMTAGLALKTALFPFHGWLPPAHSGAPPPASAMLSSLVPKASYFITIRLWFDVMPELAGNPLTLALGGLGGAAILYGSLQAFVQTRLKMVVAYSTVAQLGYLFIVFPLAGGDSAAQPWSAGAWTGGMLHALSHALAKSAMFLCAGLFIISARTDDLEALRGIAQTMPMTAFAFALAAISLMGLPPSGGFIAKYLMLTSAFASGGWIWAFLILAGGLLAALYLYRPVRIMLSLPKQPGQPFKQISRWWQVAPLVLALGAVFLGIGSNEPYALLQIGRPVAAETGL